MKVKVFLCLLYSSFLYADNQLCFNEMEVNSLKTEFLSDRNDIYNLRKTSTDIASQQLENDIVLLKNPGFITKATEIGLSWRNKGGVSGVSSIFPKSKTCVWEVSFRLPEKIRKLCDDSGAYGYYFSFIKNKDGVRLSNVANAVVDLGEGKESCDEAKVYLNSKK